MAITFDTDNRVIMLDSFNVSASDIWTAWVDWVVKEDNLKYLPAFSQIGGVAPIALYLLLENGWRVRPQESDGITTITGNLLVQGGGSPITNTIDNWQILVNMETPVAAQAIETCSGGSGGGTTAEELWNYENRSLTSDVTAGLTDEQNDKLMNVALSSQVENIPTPQEIANRVWRVDENETLRNMYNNVDTIADFQAGNWEIKDNKMIFYSRETQEIVAEYDLKNKFGNPSETAIYKREKK